MQRVVIVQQPDGTFVQQVIDVDVNVGYPAPMPNVPVIQQQPLPQQPGPGFGWSTMKNVLNGDTRWNPVTRQYEWVQLNRPPRTGWRKRLFGV
jgi:hypothetical protein